MDVKGGWTRNGKIDGKRMGREEEGGEEEGGDVER